LTERVPGRMTLVLLPGMYGTGDLFAPFIAALRPARVDTRVVRYPPREPLGLEALRRIASEALPRDVPCVLLAESFSGPIAMAVAASRPPQLRGLVLCATFVRNPQPLLSRLALCVGALPGGLRPPAALLDRMLLGPFSTAPLRSALVKAVGEVTPEVMLARLRALRAMDAASALQAVDVPTLYLQALRDRLVPDAASREVARLKPGLHVRRIDAPHALLQAVPDEAAREVARFMAELPSP
jgi:pimeloyl-ACP methyl ester carboxylesterase